MFRCAAVTSYCDIAAKLGFLAIEAADAWRRATNQAVEETALALPSPLCARTAAVLPSLVVRGDGGVSSPSHGIRAAFSPTSPEVLAAGTLRLPSDQVGTTLALYDSAGVAVGDDGDSIIVDADVAAEGHSDDESTVLAIGDTAAPPSLVPVHIAFDVVVDKHAHSTSDAALAFQHMLSTDWMTTLGRGEPPLTTVTPRVKDCVDFLWFTPVSLHVFCLFDDMR